MTTTMTATTESCSTATSKPPPSAATPQNEIERQHAEAVGLVKQGLEHAHATTTDEIPLSYKQQPTVENPLATAGDAATDFPVWSSRGRVDVSAVQELLREGYNVKAAANDESKKRTKYKASDIIVSATNLWDSVNSAVHNVSICRPSHDAWGIGKVAFVFSDDFLQRKYIFPWYSLVKQAIKPILDVLGIEERQIVRLLATSLPPGVTIPVHHDSGEWVKHSHRVHIPILVEKPDSILFRCGVDPSSLQRIQCAAGHVFEINNQAKHAVSNCDNDHRVHLILDYVDIDDTEHPRETISLQPGQVLLQTRRSVDRLADRGRRPTPTFFILGAQKAGTTSLYDYLTQHPWIVKARRRETHCLDWRWNDKCKTVEKQLEWCLKFYLADELERHPSVLTGDSTPSYLLDSKRVIPRLKRVFPHYENIRFFVMLRHPIRRAESHFAMVTSTDGTDAQLKTRGTEWRSKSIQQVITEELELMKKCGLIPYFAIDAGVVDERAFAEFSGTVSEDQAWDEYLSHIPLHTGSHCLLGRGLYELNLRPWLAAFNQRLFVVVRLDELRDNVDTCMRRAWEHLNLPYFPITDDSPKNQRQYTSQLSPEMQAYLRRFYEPHNRRLAQVVVDSGLDGSGDAEWENLWNENWYQ